MMAPGIVAMIHSIVDAGHEGRMQYTTWEATLRASHGVTADETASVVTERLEHLLRTRTEAEEG